MSIDNQNEHIFEKGLESLENNCSFEAIWDEHITAFERELNLCVCDIEVEFICVILTKRTKNSLLHCLEVVIPAPVRLSSEHFIHQNSDL